MALAFDPSTRTGAAERPAPRSFDPRTIDMRCPAACSGPHGDVRCQLLMGHDGGHALMYGDVGCRQVLVWSDGGAPAPIGGDWRSLAWMRGYPVPAWFELGD